MHRSVFLKSTYLLEPPTLEQRKTVDSDSLRFLDVIGGRVVDGVQLYSRLASLRDRNALAEFFQESPFETISTDDRPKVIRAITAWLAWCLTFFPQGEIRSAWVPERIEYEFAVSAKTKDAEVVLAAPEYLEGHLDWFSFVARPGASLNAGASRSTVTMAFLPAPVSYPRYAVPSLLGI